MYSFGSGILDGLTLEGESEKRLEGSDEYIIIRG